MSLAYVPLKTVFVEDPLVNLEKKSKFCVYKGGSRASYQPIISTSYSNYNATFSAPPPSPMTVVDRRVKIKRKCY